MSEKEYIVTLKKGVDYNAFNAEMIASTGAGDIPNRSAAVANARPASQRNTHYMLTEAEAASLNNDSRVVACELRPDLRDDVEMIRLAQQTGDFSKTDETRGDFVNWGLRRINEANNPYVGNSAPGAYNYTLDGTGVDIVIQDSGLQIDHPEFQDAAGTSRVVELDWYSGFSGGGSMPTGHYTDFDGHGTHVAGIAAGKTYGWAKNAKIYAVKVAGLEGAADTNAGIPVSDVFDIIKEWHAAKAVDPLTGAKRPTIVNMSWGYGTYFTNIIGGNYRGTSWTGTARDTAKGMIGRFDGAGYRHVVRVASVDADVEELIDAGVHVVIAAGNSKQKIDISTGLDYDNYYQKTGSGNVYYHRGGSPHSEEAFMVGNIDKDIASNGREQKSASSETGPGVNAWAPGTDIFSALSTTNVYTDGPYPADADFKIGSLGGTSMAAPQVAGVLALWLQVNPDATPAQALSYFNSSAKTDKIYQTVNNDTDYTDDRSLLGSNNRFVWNKFNRKTQLSIGSKFTEVVTEQAYIATYALSSSDPSVNEGDTFTITLTTTNVANDTQVGYTITGVSTADIGASLTGNFTVSNNTATATFTVTSDELTEGAETFTLSLQGINASVSVPISDTSLTPVGLPTYLITPAADNVDEGSALTINIATTNVADATTLYYSLTNAADFATSTGSFTVTSNAGSFSVTPTADVTTEGAETFTVQVRTDAVDGTVVATSSAITINDTSLSPGGASYALATSSSTVQEGEKTTFTLTTTNVDDATDVPYTITGVSSADLDTGPRASGSVQNTVGYGSNFFTRELRTAGVRLVSAGDVGGQTAVPDAFIEKVGRMYQLFTDRTASGINTSAQDLMIETLLGNTTSYHAPSPTIQRIARGAGADYSTNFLTDAGQRYWGIQPLFDATVQNDMVWYLNSSGTPGTGDEDAQEVIEHVFHTLHMHGLDPTVIKLYPSISSDWATGPLYLAMEEAFDAGKWDPSGYQSPSNAWKTDADAFEVAAKEYLYLLNFCMFDYSTLWDGNSLAPEWTDDMRTPAGIQSNNPLGYALHNTHIATVISKPSLTTIRSIFQDGDTGDPTQAGASGYVADAAVALTGNFTVSSDTATIDIFTAKDLTTDGSETLTLTLDNGAATENVSITDSSITQGPTYYAYPAAESIDEGSALTINVVTTDVADATTLYWSVSEAGDFATSTGSFTVTGDRGSFTVTPTADATTEGAETFTVNIRTGSVSGTSVAVTEAVTINDTSLTPSPDYTITVTNSGNSYILSGTDRNGAVSGTQPTLAFNSGDNVRFNVDAGTSSSHPFYIKTSQSTGTGNQVSGATGQGTTQLDWNTATDGTGSYGYQCSIHLAMWNTITIS